MPICRINFPFGREISFAFTYETTKFHLPHYLDGKSLKDYEPISQSSLMAVIEKTSGALFDVGSNIGLYSLNWAIAFRRDVHAFEPFTEAAAILRGIADETGLPVHVHDTAVGREVGTASFYLSSRSDMSNSLNREFRKHVGTRETPVVSIDHLALCL